MNVRVDLFVIGWLLALVGAFQVLPAAAAALYGEPMQPYAASGALALGTGVALAWSMRTDDRRIRARDGFLVVGVGWVLASAFGALPYVFTGVAEPVDAWFEAVSGFTTTGSTVLTGLDDMPRGILLWRSFTQWLGGMGIILFTIAILPLLGIGGMQLFKAEIPGPVADKIRPRLAETARRLWLVYVGLTAFECALLMLAGLDAFEAVCHSFTTLATGGFSTRDLSVAGFNSPAVEWIVTLFMLLAGMNFVLHYRVVSGRVREVGRDPELRYFLGVVAVATVVVTVVLAAGGDGPAEALRLAAFQVVSVVTTTGYVTADFEVWPALPQSVFLVLMVLGGMAGSTSGGIKSLRALLGWRTVRVSFARVAHPRIVRSVKYAGRPVEEDVLAGVRAFLAAYALVAIAGAAFVAAGGYDLTTAFSATLTALGNVGPGLGEVGAYDNFSHFPAATKVGLSVCMLAGRLEIFTLLVLLLPSFWRH